MRLSIYRYDPDKDARPCMKDYEVQLEHSDRMLLDALVKVKAQDDSIAFRRSCREGVCGSDAININGKNGLACITRVADLPGPVQGDLATAIEKTRRNTGMRLTLALNYGARTELVDAVKALMEQAGSNGASPIDEGAIARHLYTHDVPDPDLLIRTSGEMRLSNFLLWQVAYSEIWVTETLWPDFRQEDLFQAIIDFQKRERRYGGLG